MTTSSDGTHRTVRLAQGEIRYRDLGQGPVVVLVHGLLTDSTLWDPVIARLTDRFRVIAPDWPLGSHPTPMTPGADLTPGGLAGIIAGFLEALDLRDVTLVGNDTGGALCQIVAAHHPARIGRLLLTPCDAYDNFLPPFFKPLQLIARVPGGIAGMLFTLPPVIATRMPLAYGRLAKRRVDTSVVAGWLRPARRSRGIRRDVAKVLRGIDPRWTNEAAAKLRHFDKPVLLAWAPDDRFFPLASAERLAAEIPGARIERIDDSLTFVPLDQPDRTAALITEFAAVATESSPAGSRQLST